MLLRLTFFVVNLRSQQSKPSFCCFQLCSHAFLSPPLFLQDFEETMELVREYRFPVLFINQFYPRPGTAAARMRRLPTQEVKLPGWNASTSFCLLHHANSFSVVSTLSKVKNRSRELSKLFHSYLPYESEVGTRARVLVTERASDGSRFVGHDKSYRQVHEYHHSNHLREIELPPILMVNMRVVFHSCDLFWLQKSPFVA